MTIYVDADACPVIKQTEKIAKKYKIKTVLISDTNHILKSEYSEIITVDKGSDSADFVIANKCNNNDIVVTQDYGVAAMVLAKGGYPIHQNGKWYTKDNIDSFLMIRHINKKARNSKAKNHLKGPKKRTEADNIAFMDSLEKLICSVNKI
ncbi:MAG: YaiI/YqxD family protein [Lachnospirales bacterium]